jgi:hypothetical protein
MATAVTHAVYVLVLISGFIVICFFYRWVIASPVNLLKMDIEGMEYEILLSCSLDNLQKIERIALEYHDDLIRTPHRVSELVDFLSTRGFSIYLHPD